MSNDRSLRLEVVLQAIDKVTGPLGKAFQSSSKLAATLKETREQLRGMEREGKRLESFRKGADAIYQNSAALDAARAKMRELQGQIIAAERPSKNLSEAYKAQRREVLSLERSGAKLAEGHDALRRQIEATGVPVNQLAARQAELRRQMDLTNATISTQGARMAKLKAANKAYHDSLKVRDQAMNFGVGATATGAAIGAPVINAIREYSSFEDAMLGVQRQVQGVGEIGSASYKAIAAEVKALGRELPIPTNQIAEMYTAASRMEVPREGLQDFVRTVAMMATAFDAVPDEIAESMGKVAANFKIPVTEIRGLADAINYLDDNSSAKSVDIIGVLNRTAGVASSVAITEKSVAALASTLLSLGDREESASTAINAMIQKFAAAEKGSKGFKEAMGEIGLSLTDVQRGMQQDAQGTLFRVIEAIQKLPATKRTGIMVELVGMEHSDTMAKLVTNTDKWRQQIEVANSAAAKGSMEREFGKQLDALSAKWQIFKNSFFDVETESGASLRKSLTGVMESLGGMLNGAANWMRANPELTATLVQIAAVTAIVVTGMGALALAMAAVIGPFAVARYGMALFGIKGAALLPALFNLGKTALPLVGNAIMWVGRALLMNPIGLAVTAIAVAALAVYKYWEPIKEFFTGLWSQVKAAFDGGIVSISALILNWSPLGLFYKAFAGVMSWFGVDLPANFTEYGRLLLDGLVNGITGALGRAKDAIGNVGDNVIGWFKEKLGINSPSRVFAELGGFTMQGLAVGLQGAAGVPLAAITRTAGQLATAATIGMAGMGTAAAGGFTIDNRPPIGAASTPGTGPVTQHNEIHIHAAPGMDPQAIALAVSAELDRRERAKAVRSRSSLSDRY